LFVIVCNCNALRDSQVRAAARATRNPCPISVFAHLGCKPKCGQCLSHAREVVAREHCAA
jgi:bacterioferritin-associated ferredoxin